MDVELIRKKADENICKGGKTMTGSYSTPTTASTGGESSNSAHLGPPLEHNGTKVHPAKLGYGISSSSSGQQLLSLQKAVTTEKFKEIIDNLFVPTA